MNRSTLLLAAGLVFLPTSASSDTFNASRLIYRVTANGQTLAVTPVPQGVLVRYCGDSDGCKLTLKMEDGYGLEAMVTRLYLSEIDPLLWLSEASPVAGAHRDADGNTDGALSLWSGLANCGLNDLEVGGTEVAAGFTFGLVGAPGALVTCTLMVED